MSGWPEPFVAGLSLTYDGTRREHLDFAIPALDRLGYRATFFAYPPNLILYVPEWRNAAERHEMGSAFLYGATQTDGLVPNWPPEALDEERAEADELIRVVADSLPTSLALPAVRTQWSTTSADGQLETVVSGVTMRLNAEALSPIGGYKAIRTPSSGLNMPGQTDARAISSILADSLNAESLCVLAELAIQSRAWLVLVFSGLRDSGFNSEEHERFLIWLAQKRNSLLIAPFGEIAVLAASLQNVTI